jgi:hypothetical protein
MPLPGSHSAPSPELPEYRESWPAFEEAAPVISRNEEKRAVSRGFYRDRAIQVGASTAPGQADAATAAQGAGAEAAAAYNLGQAVTESAHRGQLDPAMGIPSFVYDPQACYETAVGSSADRASAAAASSAAMQLVADADVSDYQSSNAAGHQIEEPPVADTATKLTNPRLEASSAGTVAKEFLAVTPQTAERRDRQAEAVGAASQQQQRNGGESSSGAMPEADDTTAADTSVEILSHLTDLPRYTATIQEMDPFQLSEHITILERRLSDHTYIAASYQTQVDSGQGDALQRALNIMRESSKQTIQ